MKNSYSLSLLRTEPSNETNEHRAPQNLDLYDRHPAQLFRLPQSPFQELGNKPGDNLVNF